MAVPSPSLNPPRPEETPKDLLDLLLHLTVQPQNRQLVKGDGRQD